MGIQRFTPHNLAEILRDLFRSEATGCLRLSADAGEEIRIFMVCGLVDLAFQTGPHADLLAGLIQDEVMKGPLSDELRAEPPSPEQLAQLLVAGAAARPGIRDRLRAATDGAVQAGFRLSGGTCVFKEAESRPHFEPDVPQTLKTILGGIGAVSRWATVRRILSTQGGVLRPCSAPLFPVECLPLKPEQGYLLSRMDGFSTFDDLLHLLPDGEPDAVTRFVYAALVLGFVELDASLVEPFELAPYAEQGREDRAREEQELERIDLFYAALSGDNPYRVIGVTDGSSWSEIKYAYEQAKILYQAERFLPAVVQKRRDELRIIETALVEAYLKIQSLRMDAASGSDAEKDEMASIQDITGKRKEQVKTERQTEQEENDRRGHLYYQKARDYFSQGDFHNAIQYCHLSIRNSDKIAECHALLGEALGKNPAHRWQLQAEDCFKRAIDLDPWNARLYLRMAAFYRNKGMSQRAQRLEEKAYSITPSLRPDASRNRP